VMVRPPHSWGERLFGAQANLFGYWFKFQHGTNQESARGRRRSKIARKVQHGVRLKHGTTGDLIAKSPEIFVPDFCKTRN